MLLSEYESQYPCRDPSLSVQDRVVVAEAGRLAAALGGVELDGSVVPAQLECAANTAGRLADADPLGPYGGAHDYLDDGAGGRLDPIVHACARNRVREICLRSCYLEPADYLALSPDHHDG